MSVHVKFRFYSGEKAFADIKASDFKKKFDVNNYDPKKYYLVKRN